MKWSLQQLQAAEREPLVIDEQLTLANLKEDHPDIREVLPFHVKGRGVYARSLATFTLHIKGTLILPCSRTLIDVPYPIDLRVTEKFYPLSERVTESMEDDDDIHFYEGNTVDLLPAIRERILLEIPMQVYTSEEEMEQALQTGEGWDVVTGEEKKKQIDPRLAGLAKFFEKE